MKSFIKWSCASLVLLVVSLGLLASSYYLLVGRTLDASSQAWIKQALPGLLGAAGGKPVLPVGAGSVQLADPEVLKHFSEQVAPLGKVQAYGAIRGEATVHLVVGMPIATAFYVMPITFSHIKANVGIQMVRLKSQWVITAIQLANVNPAVKQIKNGK